jgi:hypothetical protein
MDMLVLHVFHSRWTIIPANAANIMTKQQYLLVLLALLEHLVLLKKALELPPAIINQNCNKYAHSRIFIGSDSQSSLMALNAGPLHDYHHSCTGYNWSDTYKSYLDIATTLNCHIYYQWIPAHVGISPNEEANDIARLCADTYPTDIQKTLPIELKALKSTLKWHLK